MGEMVSTGTSTGRDVGTAAALTGRVVESLSQVLSCSHEVIELAVTTFVAGGHLLLEDVPGVGKTTLAKALSIAVGGSSKRIQFTPDLMPSDVTGVSIYVQSADMFEFHPGPLFANVVIADEVNRANPKTQSAMLQAMGEGEVSTDGKTYELPQPYFMVATQNPIELEGTYPLPEAQLDRFMACTAFGYPSAQEETHMLTHGGGHPLDTMQQVCSIDQMLTIRAACEHVSVGEQVAEYIVSLVTRTREHPMLRFGASPRASLHLAAMARARALMQGRDFVIPDDVQHLAAAVIAHRIVLTDTDYRAASSPEAIEIIEDIVRQTPVPRADGRDVSARPGR